MTPAHLAWSLAVGAALAAAPARTAAAEGALGTQGSQGTPTAAAVRTLVMPFENVSRDAKIFWLSEAAAVLLADDLNAAGTSAIARDERREAFERLRVPPAAVLSDATVLRLAQLVGASTVIVGTLAMDGETLVVGARQIAIDSARVRATVTERGPLADLFGTFARVARPFAVTPAADLGRIQPPVAAFESYVKGLLAESPKTAIGYLQAALAAAPGYDRARLALWDAYTDQGDHRAAADAVSRVAPDSPVAERARFLLGRSQMELGRYDDAFDTYQALSLTHPTAAVFSNLGAIQLRRGGAATPTSYFARAAELDPRDSDLFFNLGYAYWSIRDAGAAIHWLREAVRRNPADGEAHYVLGTALGSAGDAVEAGREKELARRLSSTFAEWDRRPIAEQVPRGLERIKDDVSLPAGQLPVDGLSGQRDQKDLADFYVERGRRLYEQENDREALDELNRALFLDPYHAAGNLLVGRIHLRAGRLAEAIASLKIAIWSADTAPAHAALASAFVEAKDVDAALAEAKRALALDPVSPEAGAVLQRIAAAER